MTKIILAVITVAVVGFGFYIYIENHTPETPAYELPVPCCDITPPPPVPQPTPPPPPTITPEPPPPPPVSIQPVPPPPPAAPQKTFILEVDDYSSDPASITVAKGTIVTLIVRVKKTNVYYGGLELKSSVVNTGAISPGESKTVSFSASESFFLQPYWPSSGVKKDYKITVTVN